MGAPGFVVSINGQEFVTVSSEGLNILTIQLHGDVVGEELASLELTGGLYGEDDGDKHLIWLNDFELSENDELEIAFGENLVTSKAGKTVNELHPEREKAMGPWQSMEQIFNDIAQQRRVRERFTLELEHSSGVINSYETEHNVFNFALNIMWKWLNPESASIWLSSNSLQGVREQTKGKSHVRAHLRFGESVKVRVKT